jgi:hypothetical protein
MINPQWGFNPIIKNNKNALRSYIISTSPYIVESFPF